MAISKELEKRIEVIKEITMSENRAYNMMIIKFLWIAKYHGCSKIVVQGNGKDQRNLYETLNRNKDSIRKDIRQDFGENALKSTRTLNWAQRIDNQTGIAFEYLVGLEEIDIDKELRKKYKDYFLQYGELVSLVDEVNEKSGGIIITADEFAKIKKHKYSYESIERCFRKIDEKLCEEFCERVKIIKGILKKLEKYLDAMDQVAKTFLSKELEYSKDEKIYRLQFFINNKKKFAGNQNVSINEIIHYMENKNYDEMSEAGDSAVCEYIIALREQLKLAEATYLVNYSKGIFKEEKNFKKIF